MSRRRAAGAQRSCFKKKISLRPSVSAVRHSYPMQISGAVALSEIHPR